MPERAALIGWTGPVPAGLEGEVRSLSPREFRTEPLRGYAVIVLAEGALKELTLRQVLRALAPCGAQIGVTSKVEGDTRLVQWVLHGVGELLAYHEVAAWVMRRLAAPDRPLISLRRIVLESAWPLTPLQQDLIRALLRAKKLSVMGWLAELDGYDRHRLKRVLGHPPSLFVEHAKRAILDELIEVQGHTWRAACRTAGYTDASNCHRFARGNDGSPPARPAVRRLRKKRRSK